MSQSTLEQLGTHDPFAEDQTSQRPGWVVRILTRSVSGGRTGIRLLTWPLKAVVVAGILLVNPTLLLALNQQRRFKTSKRLVMFTQGKFMICWPAITMFFVFAGLNNWGILPLWLGMIYALLLWYLIYAASEDFSWGGAWNLFWFLCAVVSALAFCAEVFQWELAADIIAALEKAKVAYPTPFLAVFAIPMVITYAYAFVRRLREFRVVFEGNSFTVYNRLGKGHATHQLAHYDVIMSEPDPNEARLGYRPIALRARKQGGENYEFPTVAGGDIYLGIIQHMKAVTEVAEVAE